MSTIDNSHFDKTDISLGELLGRAAETPDLPLVFLYDGKTVKLGYHVTEVKAGQFSALDCGANPEAWAEIFVQLWDVEDGERTHMTAGKFSAIISKVSEHVRLDGSVKLTFEVSDGIQPMQLFCADEPVEADGVLTISLVPRPASCKPRDRWVAEGTARTTVCCGTATVTQCCSQ
ncbi:MULTISPECIES: DUF6428 family protein [Agrobacterium tumefaciens complex]|uniref:Uncharacterized protein n=1 Tax=Agrobacterium tomkonis CFBP 6623 TaxID=1183432 RepID=A0A1S7NZY1_9HYPH|nr:MULTISPECIES: DUF6428 family protein [Agrobacterium tumefaciens complex]NSX90932.1 hypothetical protein [Agrobacterium tumefaciens]QCL89086.1 hypothetical protein CFBP6623_08005 [Agrobacterium tumefaciens]CUX13998.1 conserved hypothetical protein [Agrobacterium tomkonis CFBP 6623]